MVKFNQNIIFNQLADKQLIILFQLRLSNQKFDGTITGIEVSERKYVNSEIEPFSVKFTLKTRQYGKEEQWLLFKSFYLDEWDYINEELEKMNVCPVSNFILKKNCEIATMDASLRGYEFTLKNIRDRIETLYKECILFNSDKNVQESDTTEAK